MTIKIIDSQNKSKVKSMPTIQIRGTGSYLPSIRVTNPMFEKLVDTSEEWITSRTGIQCRNLSDGEPVWHMGSQAASRALAAAGAAGREVDVVIASTVTPDYHTPSLSCILQDEIGATEAFCLDINAACSGFVYAYDLALRYLCDADVHNVLIVCSERLSAITDYTDRSTCVLFGDGAGAILIGKSEDGKEEADLRSFVSRATILGSEGHLGRHIVSRSEYTDHPFRTEAGGIQERFPENNGTFISMCGQEVYKFAVRVMVDSIQRVLDRNGLTMEEISWVIPHQANDRILDASAKRLGMDPAKMVSYIADLGNTSSASIPISLDRMVAEGKLHRGDRVILCGFGGGLTYGAALMVY